MKIVWTYELSEMVLETQEVPWSLFENHWPNA